MKVSVRRLAAEFVVIVFGVLVALAVDQWQDERNDRMLEAQYASRLISDLQVDTARYASLLRGPMTNKRNVLLAFSQGQMPQARNSAEMLAWLDQPTYGGIVETQSAAFREMESSGRIGLLRNPGTRDELANYYANHSFLAERYADSPGAYERLVAETIPGRVRYAYHTSEEVDEGIVSDAIGTLLSDPRLTLACPNPK